MECVNCGRRNQPTTRFCAECGDVLHADPPRERRARKVRQRKRRLRIHWVRLPPSPPPSILAVRLEPSAAADVAQRAPERMMRRIDLALAAIVGIAGLAAYFAYPYLKGSPAETPVVAIPAAEAPMVASAPMPPLDPPPPRAPADERPAPLTVPGTMAPATSSAARTLDAVPPRVQAPRAKPEPSRSRPEISASSPRPGYALTTAFAADAVPQPAVPPVRVAAAPAHSAPRKDRLQQMNDTIAGCANEGLFGRLACEQRALLSYCDGQWGKNERCPSGRTADYGN